MKVYIKEVRTAKKISLNQLAELSGLSKGSIHYIENGAVSPTIGTLCKIANVLGVPASELFSCDDE